MMEQDRLLGRAGTPYPGQGAVPEQRGAADRPLPAHEVGYAGPAYRAAGQDQAWPTGARPEASGPDGPRGPDAGEVAGGAPTGAAGEGRTPEGAGEGRGTRPVGTRLRVDARRNLESVLRAAREVFGEFGYDAPMEEVARRAGVGVGTVYRRFPSKEVLVQRIASEEVAWLTTQARESLYSGAGPWESLAEYLARAVGTGAGRLLPPEAFRYAEELGRVPGQRGSEPWPGRPRGGEQYQLISGGAPGVPDADPRLLLQLLAALVARAGAAGELRPGVTVSDVVLVLTASVPVRTGHGGSQQADGRGAEDGGIGGWAPDTRTTEGQPHSGPAARLLELLLDGLRAR
ncbi:helix-turn-helix domain-containing protein [Kitasatospora sp. NBC_00240]|uniref:helix-turn-helix domain-containing protein n=1 Tax=Kitasatospora sp. NBC_00240 TaxID=2903567 RepID=UPI002B1E38A5|nr:helix-turn-helix domain-containing protein [Kitasatospora sp. NBC_00240]